MNPDLHGPGYIVSSVGVIFLGAALLATLWYGAMTQTSLSAPATPIKPTIAPFESTLERTTPLWRPGVPMPFDPSAPTVAAEPVAPEPEKVPVGAGTR